DTPAGISTATVRSPRTRPSPRHTSQGSSTTIPSPPQVGQGDTDMNCPNMLRAVRRTSPLPPHVVQTDGLVPGRAPLPAQFSHRSSVFSLTLFLVPVATSARVSLTVTLISWPRRDSA